MPTSCPIWHNIEGENSTEFVVGVGSDIFRIFSVLYLHIVCDDFYLHNGLGCGWVMVLSLCRFGKNRFFLFFGNLHFGHIVAT